MAKSSAGRFTLPLLLTMVLPVQATGGDYRVMDRVVLVIDNEPITLSDVNEMAIPIYQYRKGVEDVSFEEVKRDVIDSLIREKVLIKEAEKSGIIISKSDVEQAVEDVAKQNKISKGTLFAELEKEGIGEEEYREQIRKELTKIKFLNIEIKSKIDISEDDIREYYRENPSLFTENEKIEITGLFIPFDEEGRAPVERIEAMRRDFIEGMEVDEVAGKYDLTGQNIIKGEFIKEELMKPLQGILFTMKVGEVCEPVKTEKGFYIVKVTKRLEGGLLPLESAKEEIQKLLYQEEMDRLMEDWFEEKKKDHSIEILYREAD